MADLFEPEIKWPDLFEAEIELLRARQAEKPGDMITFAAVQEAIEALEAIDYRVQAIRKFQEKETPRRKWRW